MFPSILCTYCVPLSARFYKIGKKRISNTRRRNPVLPDTPGVNRVYARARKRATKDGQTVVGVVLRARGDKLEPVPTVSMLNGKTKKTPQARSGLTSQVLSEDAPGTHWGMDLTRARTIRPATPAITTEYQSQSLNIAFLSQLVTRNGRPTAAFRMPNLPQRARGMDLGLCGLRIYS